MTDLTEQWKKGELPEGFYYVKCDWSDEVEIRYVHNGVDDWKAIFAEVPSYDEWFKIKNLASLSECLQEKNIECLHRENKLKELLKECELWFTGTIGNMNDKNVGEHNRNLPIGNFEHMFKVFSQKINNALED